VSLELNLFSDAVFCAYRNRAAGRAEICNLHTCKLIPQPVARALEAAVNDDNTKVRALVALGTYNVGLLPNGIMRAGSTPRAVRGRDLALSRQPDLDQAADAPDKREIDMTTVKVSAGML
jgi:hypothetical protein